MDESGSQFPPLRSQTPKRVFPPPYKSTGDPSADRLAFVHILERLKVSTHETHVQYFFTFDLD